MTTTTCSWRPYRVALRTQECRGVISLYLEPTDGALPPAFAAGQYVELRMPGIEPHAFFLVGPSGDRLVRLTIEVGDEPFIGEVGRIAKLRIGDPVELSEPKGELAMEPGETPVVIMTEDIGCLVAHAFLAEMAEVEPMRNVRVLCQFPNGTRMLMREELRKLVDLMPNAGLAVFLAAPSRQTRRERTTRSQAPSLLKTQGASASTRTRTSSSSAAGPSPKPSGPTSSSSASFTPEFTRRSSERFYPGRGSSFANLPCPCKIRPCR
ncbi:MAG: hypothetical protein ACLR8J_06850 [Sutterella wadsworthensis]